MLPAVFMINLRCGHTLDDIDLSNHVINPV